MESLTRPFFHHRRKLSSVSSSNGLSFSAKDAYDDVLLGAPKSKLAAGGASGFAASREDYGEIFGGGTVKRGSSIPVLDLSDLDKGNGSYDSGRSNGKLDYAKIFGSFAAEDDCAAMVVPPYEELFGGVKKAKCDKAKARTPADLGSPLKGSEGINSSENNRGFSSEDSDQFLDGGKQLNMSFHKTGQPSKDGLKGTTHIAQLHAVPGFTYFMDEAARPQKNEHDKPFPQVKADANHSRSSSGDLSEGKSSRRAKWRLPDRQASKGVANSEDDSSQDKFDVKPHPFRAPMPPSSSDNLNDNLGHPKRATCSSFGPKAEASEKYSSGYLSPSSDEELDLNSAAAAPAAALKKAIQQAQESIRIAKELMERQKDAQNYKSQANGSLKAKDRKEIKYDQDVSGVRNNSTKEACQIINTEVQAFGGVDQKNAIGKDKVASSFTCQQNLSVDRKVDVEKHKESAEVTEEQPMGMWFTQLINNGKNKMAALASQLVDNRNTIFQPADKQMRDTEGTTPAKDTLGRGTTVPVDIDAKLDVVGKVLDLEKNLDKSVSNQFVQGGSGSVTLMSAQEDEATEAELGFDPKEMCEKKLQDCEQTTYDKPFEPEILENSCSENELRSMVEMEEEEESLEVEMGKKPDDAFMWQENESRLDEKENWRAQEGSSLQKGDEHKPKEDTASESSEKKQESYKDKGFSGSRLEDYHQEDIDEQRSTCSLDAVENQNISEEEKPCEDIDQEPTRTYQHEDTDSIDAGADNRTDREQIEVNLEVQESGNTEGETDESTANPSADLLSEAGNEENLNACNADESTISGGTPKAAEVYNSSKLTRQLEFTDLEGDDNQTGVTGQESTEENDHIESEEDRKEAVEEASGLKENKIFEAACFDQCFTQEHVLLHGITQDASEAFASDDDAAMNFGFDTTIHEEKPSTDSSLLKTTGLTPEEPAFESENASEAPPVGDKTSTYKFSGMDGQKEIEESEEESEFSFSPENVDGLVHESGGNAENNENGIACYREVEKHDFELDNKENDWVKKQLELECSQLPGETKESEEHLETDSVMKAGQNMENYEDNICKTSVKEEQENRESVQKEAREKDLIKKIEVDQREREREKDRIAVERAIREARERAFAEARERAERAAVDRATAEVRQRAMAGAREKLEKVSAGTKVSSDKATTEAKLRAERAAVERATAEARGRALEKALSQKCTSETRAQVEKVAAGKSSAASRDTGLKHSFSSSDLEGTQNESAQRRKARLERHQRIMERAAKALAEKNMRDILAQREQAERNRLAESLDADIKRWASGKEGNLRALLSTLQYILGPDSGWQPISLTEIITTNAVKKAYRKATLYVHPDKLQQRGASIQQKYTCEKVFDLLKAAWNKFNSEER